MQRAESEFDPVPFDAEAARIFGSVKAAVIAAGANPRQRPLHGLPAEADEEEK
jgi:hypothetical protein